MTGSSPRDDLFFEFSRRREDWRARRKAWREAYRARRGQGCSRNGGWGAWHDADDVPHAESNADPLAARVADMEKTIATLTDRINVLERLAVDEETRLAREIDALRRTDGGPNAGKDPI